MDNYNDYDYDYDFPLPESPVYDDDDVDDWNLPNPDLNTDPTMPSVINVFGPPGCGATTLCKRLEQTTTIDNAYRHLCIDDILRDICDPAKEKENTDIEDGVITAIKDSLQQDKLPLAEILIPLLKDKVFPGVDKSIGEISRNIVWLVDGFPRQPASAWDFEDVIAQPMKVIWLDCPRDVAEKRYLISHADDDDREARFAKLWDQYLRTLKEIEIQYWEIMRLVPIGQNNNEFLDFFATVLH